MQNAMQQEVLDMDIEQEFQIIQQGQSANPDDFYFDTVVMALQEIVVDSEFENLQDQYMKDHCLQFQQGQQNKIEYMLIFKKYHQQIQLFLHKSFSERIAQFDMPRFLSLLESRTQRIDEQILEMLMSLSDFEVFKELILDYRATYEEEERLKVLTIKSHKIPENKTVKGSNNIFTSNAWIDFQGNSNDPLAALKSSKPKKTMGKKEKTQDEIFLPDMVLTIRPLKNK